MQVIYFFNEYIMYIYCYFINMPSVLINAVVTYLTIRRILLNCFN